MTDVISWLESEEGERWSRFHHRHIGLMQNYQSHEIVVTFATIKEDIETYSPMSQWNPGAVSTSNPWSTNYGWFAAPLGPDEVLLPSPA